MAITPQNQMEFKHFSHTHGLVFHQMPQGSETHCGGCKTPATGNVYACWQCSYFLHEQCFGAARSLKHPSHPFHPLTLSPFPTYPSASFICNTCHIGGRGFCYSCSDCEFDVHVACAHLPNPSLSSPLPNPNFNDHSQNHIYPPPAQINTSPQPYPPQTTALYPPLPIPIPNTPFAPQNFVPPAVNPPPLPPPNATVPTYSTVVNPTITTAPVTQPNNNVPPPPQPQAPQTGKPPSMIRHFSHPHVLKAMEINKSDAKVCSACECELSGPAYCCTEACCKFNLHKACFDSPREVRHKSHLQHPLKLLHAPPYSDGFTCNACLKDGRAFTYTCEACSYDLHIDCIQWPDSVSRPDHRHPLTLYYSSPAAEAAAQDATFVCDVCRNPVHEMAWVYYCRECDFGTHLECVASGIKAEGGGGSADSGGAKTQEELLRETELKFAVLQLLLGGQGGNVVLELKK